MWLPVGKNAVRRQGDGAQDGCRVDGSAGPTGGPWVECRGPLGCHNGMRERERERGCVCVCGIILSSLVTREKTSIKLVPKKERDRVAAAHKCIISIDQLLNIKHTSHYLYIPSALTKLIISHFKLVMQLI